MVRGVLQTVYKEVRGLHQAAYVLAVFTFASQILALIRDRLLAHQFGAGIELDLYYTAFRIPDLLYVLFASTLSVYVLIPFIADRITGTDSSKAKHLLSQIFSLFCVAYAVLAVIIGIFAPSITSFVFPGVTENQEELVLLIRILLLQPFLLGLSSLFGVITQLTSRFVLYALSPLIYNIGIIFGLIFLYPTLGLSGLAFGVVLGALGHLLIQIPFVFVNELAPEIVTKISFADIRAVLQTSIPRALTLSLHQFVLLGLVGFATIMSEGSVSVFQFAFNLQSVPLAIIGISYSVAAFPLLAKLHSEHNIELFKRNVVTALRHIIFWSVPLIALIVVIRAQLVRVVLGTGAFDWDDTRLTAAILAILVISLTSQAIHMLVVRTLYATGDTKTPFLTTLFSSVAAIIFAFVFYVCLVSFPSALGWLENVMRLSGVSGTEVLALPLGYSLALILNSVVLVMVSKTKLAIPFGSIRKQLFQGFAAAIVAGFSAYTALNFFVFLLITETFAGIFLQGVIAAVVGVIGAICTYAILGSNELSEVYQALHKKIFRTVVVVPQDEDQLSV